MVQKSTHQDIITMFQPLVKDASGKYLAVLTSDSLDRDGEIVGKSAQLSIMNSDGYTAMLFDHENKAMHQVGEWIDKRIVDIEGASALVAEPKWFLSNPNAKVLKGMLDEGAKMGVSIGAIPKDYKMEKINGRETRVYTDVELVEASIVAVPSNRHGMISAIAKKAKLYKKTVGEPMEIEELQKQFDTAVSEKEELSKKLEDTSKALEDSKLEAAEVQKAFDAFKIEAEKKAEDLEKSLAEKTDSLTKKDDELEKLSADLEIEKKKPLHKSTSFQDLEEEQKQDVEKALDEGKIPVLHNN